MVDTHILVQGFGRRQGEMTSFKKRTLSFKNSSPDSKADFAKKTIWYLEVNIECVAYNIEYAKYNMKYLIFKTGYSK